MMNNAQNSCTVSVCGLSVKAHKVIV